VVVVGAGLSACVGEDLTAVGFEVVCSSRDRVGGRSGPTPPRRQPTTGGSGSDEQPRTAALAPSSRHHLPHLRAGEAVEWRAGSAAPMSADPTSDRTPPLTASTISTSISPLSTCRRRPGAHGAADLDGQTLATWLAEHVGASPARVMLDVAIKGHLRTGAES